MINNPNELTIENSALVLIDHQPAVGLAVHSIDQGLLVTNVASLARAAKALGVPTVLTTIGARGSVLVDPIFKEISDAFPEITPIDRTTTHAWSDPNFRAAVDATGRKKLIMAGIVTGTCLSQSVIAALKDGFEVYFVSDCSGDVSKEAHDDAKVLMTQAGAKPITWLNLTGQWAPDYRSPQRAALGSIYSQRIGTVALMTEYVIDQVTAGVVPPPDFLSASCSSGGSVISVLTVLTTVGAQANQPSTIRLAGLAPGATVIHDAWVYNSNCEALNDRSTSCDVDSCAAHRPVWRDEAVGQSKDSRGHDDARGRTLCPFTRRDGTYIRHAVCHTSHIQAGVRARVLLLRGRDRDGAVARRLEGQSVHPDRAALDRRLHPGSIDLFLKSRQPRGLTPTNAGKEVKRSQCDDLRPSRPRPGQSRVRAAGRSRAARANRRSARQPRVHRTGRRQRCARAAVGTGRDPRRRR